MEAIGLAVSIINILQLSQTVISILNEIKHKPSEARQLMLELSVIRGYLQSLRFLGEESPEEVGRQTIWVSLLSPGSPIEQLGGILERLQKMLSPARDVQRTQLKRLMFSLSEKEVLIALDGLERVKTVLALALTADAR